jgi:excinuclease ABC subunit C
MQRSDLKKLTLPDTPGVYSFCDADGGILYIGKATSLTDRVRSYFSNDLIETRGPRLVDMVTRAHTVTYIQTDSVLEALLLEARLIRQHMPSYNTEGKDDKSFTYVVITKEPFPRVLSVRGTDLSLWDTRPTQAVYGPFPHAGQLKEALRIIRKIFPYFDTKQPVTEVRRKIERGKIQFNQTIGLYPSTDNPKEYAQTIRRIMLLFAGRKPEVLRSLSMQMRRDAKALRFEAAAIAKRQIDALTHIRDVSLLKDEFRSPHSAGVRIEAFDVAHIQGSAMVGVLTVVENGMSAPGEYRRFKIATVHKANDTAALAEILSRRLTHTEWPYPKLMVVDGSTAQIRAAQKVLADAGVAIPVVAVTKDERHQPKRVVGPTHLVRAFEADIILANQEAHRFAVSYHRSVRARPFRQN